MSLYLYLWLYLPFHASKLPFSIFAYKAYIGMAMGQGGSERWDLCLRLAWFFFIPSLPPPYMTVKIFLLHPRPLESYETPPHPVKLNFLLICPQLLHLFLIKPISLIKIYLKLKINLSYQIKLIFSKNWIILLMCLIIQYHNKNKNLIIQNQWFNSI